LTITAGVLLKKMFGENAVESDHAILVRNRLVDLRDDFPDLLLR
jgi:hypothetical protein